ncbi:hypothetical protein BKA56DRAFT_567950 [Ilyonectria sp. MPI-CAGE-AT-0026]|nr:hypothetical protein BKA56DRAFT_567950 [Ilyonectria sp. MPI-CAGE-AT-0026]
MRLNASRFGRVGSYVCCVVLGLMPVGRDAAKFDVPLVPCLSTGDATDAHTPPSADNDYGRQIITVSRSIEPL